MSTFNANLLEVDLIEPVIHYFRTRGYTVALEVPIYRNRADMVVYTENELIAIELKLTRWQRALRQAGYYQLGADYTYIAMPFNEAFEVYKNRKILKRQRVGLLAVILDQNEVRELVEPQISVKKLYFIENHIRHYIKGKMIDDEFFEFEEE